MARKLNPKTEDKPSDPKALHAQLIRNIERKVKDGATLEPSEAKILQAHIETAISEKSGSDWVSSYQALGEVLGCHRASFPRWRRSYPDCPRAREDGHHNVGQWRDFFKAHPEIRGAGDITVEMQLLELEDMRQKVRKAISLNDIRDKLYTKNEIFAARISKAVTEAKNLLRQKFEYELPGYTQKQDAAQIRVLNKRAIDECCARLSSLIE